jgi:tRNA modification GTPase
VVLDSTQELSAEDHELLAASGKRHALAVANKSDLAPDGQPNLAEMKVFRTSAITGAGIESLRAAILEEVAGHAVRGEQEAGFLTNIRHQRLVEESLNCLEATAHAVWRSIPHEMIMLDLYGALRPLDAITGETTTDDILNLIFSSFCIGK